MLSKEEIKSHIDLVKLPQYKANSTEKALVEYIDQLETDKQNLIEKLEEDKDKHYDTCMGCYASILLEIAKGVEG